MISNRWSRRWLGAGLVLVLAAGAFAALSPAPQAAGTMSCNDAIEAYNQTLRAYNECLGSYSQAVCDANVPLDFAGSQVLLCCDIHWE